MEGTEVQNVATKKKGSVWTIGFYITLFLISGTCSLIFGKFLYYLSVWFIFRYQSEAIGRDGKLHHFEKPWFSNFIMFFGMSFLLAKFEVRFVVVC